jgi:precorrin isomerase
LTAIPKAVEAMRRAAVNVKRMVADVYMCACGVEYKLRCQEVGKCLVVNNISKT